MDTALFKGRRGLSGEDSLRKLLARRRGVRNKSTLPSLTAGRIRARTGEWPRVKSGPIPEAPRETWPGVNAALTAGRRGLPGGSSLARLLAGWGGTGR